MPGRRTHNRPPAAPVPEELEALTPEDILMQALDLPGERGNTYTRFRNLSISNQVALAMQGVTEPVNSFQRWRDDFNRHVTKGATAKYIRRPLFRKVMEDGEDKEKLTGFKWVKCMFEVSDTEGDPLPEYETPEWSQERALGSLAITQVPFVSMEGNSQGYSYGRNVAINPVAAYPFKTLVHEIGHIEAGHTTPDTLEEYQTHRGLKEFEAEGTAYIVLNRLGALALFNAAESRHYIQTWLQGEKPPEESITKVLALSDRIVKAGRAEVTKDNNDEE